MIANVVIFRIQQRATLVLYDFMDFLLRTRWELLNHKRDRNLVGNYLRAYFKKPNFCTKIHFKTFTY